MPDQNLVDSPQIRAVAAALFGGFISKRFRRDMPVRLWVYTVISLSGMGFIFSLVPEFYGNHTGKLAVLCVFIGMYGVPICQALNDAIPKIDIAGIIKSRLGGN